MINFIFSGPSIPPASILNELLRYELPTYLETVVIPQKRCFANLSTETIMSWQKNLITAPITRIPIQHQTLCLNLFKSDIYTQYLGLMGYMGDRTTGNPQSHHVSKHIKNSIYAPIEVKDEAYIQVLKQINKHPDT